jgi:hypothetical protein
MTLGRRRGRAYAAMIATWRGSEWFFGAMGNELRPADVVVAVIVDGLFGGKAVEGC